MAPRALSATPSSPPCPFSDKDKFTLRNKHQLTFELVSNQNYGVSTKYYHNYLTGSKTLSILEQK